MEGKGLVVGNYCHDVLIRNGVVVSETLGGSASFVSNVLDSLSKTTTTSSSPHCYVSKVGPDFSYSRSVSRHPPIICSFPSKTTLFHAYFSSSSSNNNNDDDDDDRILRRIHACATISPSDLPPPPPSPQFDFGLAIGVAGEITPETLDRMLDLCRHVFVDVQALVRTFDPSDGAVRLVALKDSGFHHLLPRISFLKASAEEAVFVDVEEARAHCCVIVTDGEEGCRIYWRDGEMQIPSFRTVQIDSTGAGDSFFGGFVAGLCWGLAVPDAALLGNFFGALTVSQIGVPKFSPKMLKKVKYRLERKMRSISCHESGEEFDFRKSVEHGELRTFLVEAAKLQATDVNFDDQQESQNAQAMEQNNHQDNSNQQKIVLSSVCEVIRPTEEQDKNGPINSCSFCE
ncbi:hypothetical protein MRB53_013062 [Persea americana]|uniref:Uncharacterized protein n=1 Tax=Persea americana TaxID=3435 RepID=A0ACC2K6Y0_PERAE|nr:hypothetical protein MRB53_013062 [Persea americana]